MKKSVEPLYTPIKLQQIREKLSEKVQKKRWTDMMLKPKKKGLFDRIKQWF